MAHRRAEMDALGVTPASHLSRFSSGRIARIAGNVIVRQRPGTAKGFVFLTLEDETGLSQAIVAPPLFAEHRALIVSAPGLIIQGILQNQEGQPSLRAERFWPLEGMSEEVQSYDFH